jgi:hypothetical protein
MKTKALVTLVLIAIFLCCVFVVFPVKKQKIELLHRQGQMPLDSSIDLMCDAARRGDCKALEYLLDDGAVTDAVNTNDQTAIQLAVEAGHRDAVLLLLGRGAPLWGLTKKGQTLLHVAVKANRREMVELLLALGLSEGLADANSIYALDLARKLNLPEIADALLHPPAVDKKKLQKEIRKHQRVYAVPTGADANGLVMTPDGKHGWVFGRKGIEEFDTVTAKLGKCYSNIPPPIVATYCSSGADKGTIFFVTRNNLGALKTHEKNFRILSCSPNWRLTHHGDSSVFSSDGRFWWLSSSAAENAMVGAFPPALFRVDLTKSEFRELQISEKKTNDVLRFCYDYDCSRLLVSGGYGRWICVSQQTSNILSVFRDDGETPIKKITLAHKPVLMECTKDGRLVSAGTNGLVVTDLETGKVKAYVPLKGKAKALCVDASGENAFVALGGDTVHMVDLVTGRVTRHIEIVRPLGTPGADSTYGRSLWGIVSLSWADKPRRLIGLGYSSHVLFVARY